MGKIRDMVAAMEEGENTPFHQRAKEAGTVGQASHIKQMLRFVMNKMRGQADPGLVDRCVREEYMS